MPLKFAVICGCYQTADVPAELLSRLRDSGPSLPTLHCIGRAEDGSSKPAEELAACFPSAEILWHDNGPAMPPASWWEETKAFPERVIGGTAWVTQWSRPRRY